MPSIVLLAYYYPPLGGIATQRSLSFARRLPALGWDVVVVTPRRGAYGLDPTLPGDDALPGVRVVRTSSFEPAVIAAKLRRGKGATSAAGEMVEGAGRGAVTSLVRRALARTVYFPDHARGWIGSAARAAKRAAKESGAAAIVSTSPPVSAHVAALRAARSLGLPAVLDFRDLWMADDATAARGPAKERLEREILREAAAVTTVSEAWRRTLLARFGEGRAKPFHVLRNGFEDADFTGPPPPREPGVFRIVHAGSLYGAKQDTSGFFRALAAARAEGAFAGRRLEVVLAGKVDEHALRAARAACGDALVLPGFVPHPEAVRLLRSATVNLLFTWSDAGPLAAGHLPGKMYEEIAAARPILALVPPGCEAPSLLEEAGGAIVAAPDDEAAIHVALARLADADRAGDALAAVPPPRGVAARFSRSSVAAQLAHLLASLTR